jgi:hypothetical protein
VHVNPPFRPSSSAQADDRVTTGACREYWIARVRGQ